MAPGRCTRRTVAAVAVTLMLAASCYGPAGEGEAAPSRAGWRPILDEAFSGTGLDRSRWGTCHWWAPEGCTIATNDELEWYQADAVAVRDGALRLTARPEQVTGEGRRFGYVSGMVSSGRPGDDPDDIARVAFTYGRVEVRFRVPRGKGVWPAIWMLPTTNRARPEIDLLEVYGDEPDRPSMTLHDTRGGRERTEVRSADLSVGWHTVVLEWSRDQLTWSIDGTERFAVQGDQVPRQEMYLVANLAVGGPAGTPDASTPFPSTFLVSSIRVWQRR